MFSVFAGSSMFLFAAIIADAWDRRDEIGGIDRIRYDVVAEQVYEGTVASRGHVIDGLMYFALRMSDGTVEVQIGPEEFVERSGFKLKIGEVVTTVGMPVVWNGRHIILAREVSNMTSVLTVRDRDGYPMWDMNRPIEMDPERSAFRLCEMMKP